MGYPFVAPGDGDKKSEILLLVVTHHLHHHKFCVHAFSFLSYYRDQYFKHNSCFNKTKVWNHLS